MLEAKVKELSTIERETILIDLVNAYMSPAFGALPKNEVELLMLNALVSIGYIDEEPKVYDLVSSLKITRSKARNLIYERELRRSSLADLDKKVIDVLKKPILQKDGKNFVLEIENPLVLDHLKSKVQESGHLSDGSFSPAIVKLSIEATVALIDKYLDDDSKEKAQKRLIKAGAPDKSLTGMLKASLLKLSSKVAANTGEAIVEDISDYLEPFIKEPLSELKKTVESIFPKKEEGV